MTDRPILFSGPMVRAILEGRKTQTRRILKLRKYDGFFQFGPSDTPGYDWHFRRKDHVWEDYRHDELLKLLPVQTGDRLWVRENWRVGAWHYGNAELALDYCDGPRKEWLEVEDSDLMFRLIDQSRADARKANVSLNELTHWEYSWSPGNSPCRWRPSIHMPRWASRITAPVTDVRVERLQDISVTDAITEGCRPFFDHSDPHTLYGPNGAPHEMAPLKGPVDDFQQLWDSLNAKPKPKYGRDELGREIITHYESFPWGGESGTETHRGKPHVITANPWVAAYTFKPVFQNIDLIEVAA